MGSCNSTDAPRTETENLEARQPDEGAEQSQTQKDVQPEEKQQEAESKEAQESADPVEQPPAPKLTVCIVGARGLRDADWYPWPNKSDCFCEVKVGEREAVVHKTAVMPDTLEPVWNEEFGVVEYTQGEALHFVVYDKDLVRNDVLGKYTLSSSDFEQLGYNGEVELAEAGKGHQAFLKLKVKMEGQEYPAGPSPEVSIKVARPAKKTFGLEIDALDEVNAYVTGLKAGAFQEYDKGVKAAEQLVPGDFIIKVNEVEGNAAKMLEELKKATEVSVVVRRPHEVVVAIDKKTAKAPLGLEFPKQKTGNTLLIKSVGKGPFEEWNTAHKDTDREVKSGDRIIAVGSFRGTAAQLQKKLAAASSTCQVTIVRASCPTKTWWFW